MQAIQINKLILVARFFKNAIRQQIHDEMQFADCLYQYMKPWKSPAVSPGKYVQICIKNCIMELLDLMI
jgi:hypothetical protein